jgi:hypothetical protein
LFPAAALLVGAVLHDLLSGSSPVTSRAIFYSYLPVAISLLLVLIYLILFPPVDLLAEGGIDLKLIYVIAVWLVVCCFISVGLIIRRKYNLFIGSIVGTVITVFLLSLIFIAPQIEPYRSGKGLAQKIDTQLEPSENLVFYDKADDTFLFYTNRRATVLKTTKQLRKYLAADRRVFCIVRLKDWDDIETLHSRIHIVARQGDKFIVSNKKPNI